MLTRIFRNPIFNRLLLTSGRAICLQKRSYSRVVKKPHYHDMQAINISPRSRYISYPPSFMERVEKVVTENLANEDFCMADLEANLLLSSSQIYRKIKHETGASPSVYIRNRRLQLARKMMLQSDLSLSEIAYSVGFNTLSYFSRCFTNRFGQSPSKFRRYP